MLLLDGCLSRISPRLCNWTFVFLVYINDLSNNLISNSKSFVDDRSLFSTVTDPNATENKISNDLHNINHNINTWAYQWKMNFNSDPSKQAQDVIFSNKINVTAHLHFVFNDNPVHETQLKGILGCFSITS